MNCMVLQRTRVTFFEFNAQYFYHLFLKIDNTLIFPMKLNMKAIIIQLIDNENYEIEL